VLIARDIRAQLDLEEQLRHSQKMEAVGRLAGGVAHDFNNLLTGILGFADLLEQQLRDGGTDAEHLDLLHGLRGAAKRAADLTWQLLAFSRRGRIRKERVDVHEIVRQTVAILQHTINPKIALRLELEAKASLVVGDASQLQSAFLNLGLNARDAMPEGGVLTFRSRTLYHVPADGNGAAPELPEGTYLEVSVEDTGKGVPAEHLPRIFEPFFTTKKLGEGTGLGLPAVYGTMQAHQGSVTVASEPGKGACFTCLLPLAVGREAEVVHSATPDLDSEGGLVLVVDDEEMLRSVVTRLLVRMGHTVIAARNGEEGVRAFGEHHGDLTMVLLDMQMPVMDGIEAYGRMRAIDATVPILLTTGNSIEQARLPGARVENFLQKPYTLDSLADAMGKLLRLNARG
jgi:two-component system, cell cycle sensor histidine kinase and response regulator CckA